MMKLVYPAYFTPLSEQSGYCVTVPDLPGCTTQGHSLPEAIEMAVDAASGWVLDAMEDGEYPPAASNAADIPLQKAGDFVNLIVLDMDTYAEKYGSQAIRKNCTIPAWLNTMAENAKINFSAVLQNALKHELHI